MRKQFCIFAISGLFAYSLLQAQSPYIEMDDHRKYVIEIKDNFEENHIRCQVKEGEDYKDYKPDEITAYFIPPDKNYYSKRVDTRYSSKQYFLKRLNDYPAVYSLNINGTFSFFVEEDKDSALICLPQERDELFAALGSYFPNHPWGEREIQKIKVNENSVLQYLQSNYKGWKASVNNPGVGAGFGSDIIGYGSFDKRYEGSFLFRTIGIRAVYDQPIALTNFYARTEAVVNYHITLENEHENNHISFGPSVDIQYVFEGDIVRPFLGYGYGIFLTTISKYYIDYPASMTLYTSKRFTFGTKVILENGNSLYVSLLRMKGGIISMDEWGSWGLNIGFIF